MDRYDIIKFTGIADCPLTTEYRIYASLSPSRSDVLLHFISKGECTT